MTMISDAIETLRFNALHLIAEDDKDDALFTLEVARDVMREVADNLAASPPPSGEAGEPVAWRWKIKGGIDAWHWSPEKPSFSPRDEAFYVFDLQPLYALPTIKEPTDGK